HPCPGTICVNTTANTIFVGGLSSFSNWSATQLVPTAGEASVSGRVVTTTGIGLGGALMTLRDTDGNAVTTTTDAFGFYTFEDVPAGETYTLTPQLKLFVFTPQVIVVEDDTEVNFIGQSSIKRGR
ncbi:MAG TPA: carboxypeptidase-like regulatory domain-containing protein, partial [Pyrinomonadaceae bacterium]|nr:carboxypeptidase-like regulatory domain-containing protein [Pyrinomonadaceae bacterium]